MRIVAKLLMGVSRYYFSGELIFVDVVDCYLVIFGGDVCHNEILVQS